MKTKDTIETERLVLRHFVKEDADAMFNNWANDPEVAKYMTWNPHQSVEETKCIINIWLEEYKDPKTIRYAITLKDTGEVIGGIDVPRFNNDDVPEVGYCLSRKYWNKGYMTEACTALVKYIFDLGYKEITIAADERNIGSNRVIQKCGFEFNHKEKRQCSEWKPEIVTLNWYIRTK